MVKSIHKIYSKKLHKLKEAWVLAVREVLVLLHKYAHLVFSRTFVMKALRTIKTGVKNTALFTMKATAMSLVGVIIFVPLFQAFEAHIINVTATPIQIDPPVLDLPGAGTPWYNPVGVFGLTAPINVKITDSDPDALYIYYTVQTGTTTPAAVPDPVCGGALGGLVSGSYSVNVSGDTVIKAIACDGNTASAHQSVINTKIYSGACQEQLAPELTSGMAVLAAGGSNSADNVLAGSNVSITGSAQSNHDIKASDSVVSRSISGNATASGNIDPGFSIGGSVATGAPATVLPDLNLAYWQNHARAGGSVSGNIIIPNSVSATISMGPSEIMGDVSIGTDNNVVLTGPLYIHGNLSIHANTVVSQGVAFANRNSIVVVDGTINIDTNVTFVNAGGSGAIILASTHPAISDSVAVIDVNSNSSAHDLGDVILYAQNGNVRLHSNNQVIGIYAAHGNDSAYPAVILDDNTLVKTRTLSRYIGCGEPFYAYSKVVINEFLPNPAGNDNAPKPAGEWVELYNGSSVDMDVNGWVLYDNNNANDLPITATSTNTGGTLIPSHGFLVVYRNGNANFDLNNSGADAVRLFNKPITAGGVLIDSHNYNYGSAIPDNKSFARMPDGTANWIDPEPTPGLPNDAFVVQMNDAPPIIFNNDDNASTTQASLAEATGSPDSLLNSSSTPEQVLPEILQGASAPDSTTTADTVSNGGGGSGGSDVSGTADQNISPSDATTTPDSNATSTVSSDPGTLPDNSTSTKPSDILSSDNSGATAPPLPDLSPPPPVTPPADNTDSSKQQDTITPPPDPAPAAGE